MESPNEPHAPIRRIPLATGALFAFVVALVAGGAVAGGALLERAAIHTGDPEGRAASAELTLSLEVRAAAENAFGSAAGPAADASEAPSLDAAILDAMDDSGVLAASAHASGPDDGPDPAPPEGDGR